MSDFKSHPLFDEIVAITILYTLEKEGAKSPLEEKDSQLFYGWMDASWVDGWDDMAQAYALEIIRKKVKELKGE